MRATCPTEAAEQPVLGAAPPTVFTRWTLVTLLNEPSGPTDLAVSNNQGIASACGASIRSFQWARCTSAFELISEEGPFPTWRDRLLDAFEGHARNAVHV